MHIYQLYRENKLTASGDEFTDGERTLDYPSQAEVLQAIVELRSAEHDVEQATRSLLDNGVDPNLLRGRE